MNLSSIFGIETPVPIVDKSFSSTDLVNGIYTLAGTTVIGAVLDETGRVTMPDIIYGTSSTTIDMTNYVSTMTGTWKIRFAASSGSSNLLIEERTTDYTANADNVGKIWMRTDLSGYTVKTVIKNQVATNNQNFVTMNQTVRGWLSMAAAPNGNIYAAEYLGDIYMQTDGTGDFVALNQTSRYWLGMSAASNGDIYACVYNGDIYKQTGGVGNFVGLGQATMRWSDTVVTENGDIYACVYNGDIYKQTGGVGSFVALGQATVDWTAMTVAANGDVYACASGSDIYKQTGGVGSFVALGQGNAAWYGITANTVGDVYACVSGGDIYRQTAGVGNFVTLSQGNASWSDLTTSKKTGDVYASVQSGGNLYKMPFSTAYEVGYSVKTFPLQ